jgi:hypothetical protein
LAKANPSGCFECQADVADERWSKLPLVQVLRGEDLVPGVVTQWPGGAIEVRKCVDCGRTVARMATSRFAQFARKVAGEMARRSVGVFIVLAGALALLGGCRRDEGYERPVKPVRVQAASSAGRIDVRSILGPGVRDNLATPPAVALVPGGEVTDDQFVDVAHGTLLPLFVCRVARLLPT